jgi:quercetin dioxygenase-like cupin family protein
MKRVIVNPVFGDTCTFIKTAAETNHLYSEMEVVLNPQGGNPLHTHSAFTETFRTLEGRLGLRVNGRKIVLLPGESYTVQPGDEHQFFNEESTPVKFNLIFMPGHTGAENMLRIIYGVAADGQADKTGIPKSIMTIALVGQMGDSALTGIMGLINPILRLLSFIGRKQKWDKELLDRYCR